MLRKCQKSNHSIHACIHQLNYSLTHLTTINLLSTIYEKIELEISNEGKKVPV